MRIVLMLSFITASILFGLYKGVSGKKPIWWQWFAIIWIALAACLTLLPPLAGNFSTARMSANFPGQEIIPVSFLLDKSTISKNSDGNWEVEAKQIAHIFSKNLDTDRKYNLIWSGDESILKNLTGGEIIANISYYKENDSYNLSEILSEDPLVIFPFIPALDQRVRNLNFHVPMSWVATIAFFVSMIFSIKYLKNNQHENDIKAYSSAFIGLIFAILATVTGMVWAKFNWGSFWNNDPRQLTILAILIIYAAYLALRSAIDDEEKKAKISAVYSIFSFATVPFLAFIIPRQFASLHPGAKDDGTTGPVIDAASGMLDSALAVSYYMSLAGFIILFFWLLGIYSRYKLIEHKILEEENV